MNREEAKKILPILTAFVEGKQIQWFDHDTNKWIDCTRNGIADYHFSRTMMITASSPSRHIARSRMQKSVGMKCRSINHLDG